MIIAFRPLRNPNPLGFPGGVMPGFDPSHPAANDLVYFSGISLGANFVGLNNGVSGTITGASVAAVMDRSIGPASNITSTGLITFSCSSAAQTVATLAAVFVPNSLGATNQFLCGNFAGGADDSLAVNSTNFVFLDAAGAHNIVGPAPIAGIPYLFIVSLLPAGTLANWLVCRLDTGQTTSGVAVASGLNGTGAGSVYIGNRGDTSNRPANSSIAAVMYSKTYLSLPQLSQWAQKPWSFWYPDNPLLVMRGGGFIPAWAIPSNYISSGGYAT